MGPAAGSPKVEMIVEFEGSLLNPKLFAMLFANIPLLVAMYCERICWTAVSFLRMPSKLSFPNTVNKFGVSVWSERLAPTDGLLTITGRPKDLSKAPSPIPDNWSSWGVLTAPADRMTSFRAVTTKVSVMGLLPGVPVKTTLLNEGGDVVVS